MCEMSMHGYHFIRLHICMHMDVYMIVSAYVHVCTCMYVCKYIFTNEYIYICLYMYYMDVTSLWMYKCMYFCIYLLCTYSYIFVMCPCIFV